ncbi:hypothetical protein [Nocardia sp. NPDC127526]|uniref:hypothetical protein n=1 Tax=Nocardia sp. NPDC127526 TaxID=3345393 RepID=UPI003627E79F
MRDISYRGSGPYCYANCLAMMFGADAPDVAVIETVTGSPFGMQLPGGELPFFDAFGWNPDIGIGEALELLGWTATTSSDEDARGALERLRSAVAEGPVMVGPLEMGQLRYQPGMTGPIGADHFLIVLALDAEWVTVHDPQGYPYARIPVSEFTAAWQADTLDYGRPFTLRTNFVRHTPVDPKAAVVGALPRAIDRLSGKDVTDLLPGSLGNGDAARALAARVGSGCDQQLREHLVHFAVRVGTRRLADAATCLHSVGHTAAATIATEQARLVGSLQYALVVGDDAGAADTLHTLASTYDELRTALEGR